MQAEISMNPVQMIFLGVLFFLVLSSLICSQKKRGRRERPDPVIIYGPIRAMYVCYQCDTIFNSSRCPRCNEEAVVPLIQLTGSIMEDERIAAVVGRLQGPGTRKSLNPETLREEQRVRRMAAPGLELSSGEQPAGWDCTIAQRVGVPLNGSQTPAQSKDGV